MPILTTLVLSGAAASIWTLVKTSKQQKEKLDHDRDEVKQELILAHKPVKPKKVRSPAEAEAAQQQYVSLGALSLFGLSALTSPWITIAGLPLLAYNSFYYLKKIRDAYRKKSKLAVLLFDGLSIGLTVYMALMTAYASLFFMASLLFTTMFTAQRLIAKTEHEAQTDFSRIFGELSNTVWLRVDGVEVETLLEHIKAGDTLVVHAGEMIPVDGHVMAGEGLVDQHLLTGESQPAEKKSGDAVLTSTLLLSGALTIAVEKQGNETITGQIAEALQHAATFKHQIQSRGDRIVEKGASRTMLACVAAYPILGMGPAVALSYSGFGYQMRTAAPLMVLNYLRIASGHGILIKDGRALDKLSTIDTVVFDKTGTLTEAVPQIERMVACEGVDERQLLHYAASAEQHQKHPIAQAICRQANEQNLPLLTLANNDYVIGHGLRATVIDPERMSVHQTLLIGSQQFIQTAGIAVPASIERLQAEASEKGHSMVYIALEDGRLMGIIELRPAIRRQAHEAIAALHQLGMTLYIISGDQEKPTQHLAQTLGIDHYFAETLPKDKANIIQRLQAEGRKVCFIGDGINDSVALQQADVSISLHGAATIAQDTAEIVLMTADLLHLPYLVTLSRELQQRMNHSEWLNNASGITCVSGVLFLGMGLGGAIVLYAGGLCLNMSTAMLPLLKHTRNK